MTFFQQIFKLTVILDLCLKRNPNGTLVGGDKRETRKVLQVFRVGFIGTRR